MATFFILLSTFIYKVCYNEHAKTNEDITQFVAVFGHGSHELVFGNDGLEIVTDGCQDGIPDTCT